MYLPCDVVTVDADLASFAGFYKPSLIYTQRPELIPGQVSFGIQGFIAS
jgi:hypothetical protein